MTIDRRLHDAGQRLAVMPVEVPNLASLDRRRPRRHTVRRLAIALACLGAISAGVVAASRVDRAPVSATPEPSDVSVGTVDTYALRLDGAVLRIDDDRRAANARVQIWRNGASTTYLVLVVREGGAVDYPGPSELRPGPDAGAMSVGDGTAWFTGAAEPTTDTITMWWARANRDLWVLTGDWFRTEPIPSSDAVSLLVDWALEISASPTPTSVRDAQIVGGSLQPIAVDTSGLYRSRARVWTYQGQEVTLLATENSVAAGMASVLALGEPEPIQVAGFPAWRQRSSDGQIVVGWSVSNPHPTWFRLVIPPALAGAADTIIAGLTPEERAN